MENTSNNQSNQPTHLVKVRHGHGKNASYERIGAAWLNEQYGSLYVKLHGTQIIDDGFTLFPITEEETQAPQ